MIVEVEAYHHTEPAAHSYGGTTERNAVMFGPPGYAYVYRSYGLHWCVNFVCEGRARPPPSSSAPSSPRRPCPDAPPPRAEGGAPALSGPGRLTQAMGITHAHNGLALDEAPFSLISRTEEPEILTGPRIGITKAADLPWRYGLEGSRHLSKPFPP